MRKAVERRLTLEGPTPRVCRTDAKHWRRTRLARALVASMLSQNESSTNSVELVAVLADTTTAGPQPRLVLPCYLVNNLTRNTEEQCKFVIDNDCTEEDGPIDYVYLVYCMMGYELRYAAIGLIVFLVIVLFLNLSSVADEYLCPSLLTVAKNLQMSDSLAVSLAS